LVENAIKHGIAPNLGPGEVVVWVGTPAERLEFTVRDSGRGVRDLGPGEEREGRGLSITRRRLENLYGKDFSMVARNLEPNGFEVRIGIPRQKLESARVGNHA
jgi:LytS/YehU family sensor histidine kinase